MAPRAHVASALSFPGRCCGNLNIIATALRRVPDIIIAAGIVGCAIALGAGFRWVGAGCLLAALLVGWKRNWCTTALEDLASIRKVGPDSGADLGVAEAVTPETITDVTH